MIIFTIIKLYCYSKGTSKCSKNIIIGSITMENELSKITKIVLILILFISPVSYAKKNYRIYLDADFVGTKSSSISIQQGINTALAEEHYHIAGFSFELVTKDHRGNSLRSKRNLESFLTDEQAIVVFSGLHSPPLLANKSFINSNHILVLDPWAAAGPITRSKDENNWIFRLSIDDSNAGIFISEQALKEGFQKPFLLLEDTGWGRSNRSTMTKALRSKNIEPKGVTWFNWGVGVNHAKVLLREAKSSGADVIFFVGNANEGKVFAKAMIAIEKEVQLPIRSHWGITGGNFAEVINKEIRKSLDIQFIQTNFSFLSSAKTPLSEAVFLQAKTMFDEINKPSDIKAQTGFIHAYDLTKIFIAAVKQAGLTGNKQKDIHTIKLALENLKTPVKGLIKMYKKPFSAYSLKNKNAHEALSIRDYSMGYYQENNSIHILHQQ